MSVCLEVCVRQEMLDEVQASLRKAMKRKKKYVVKQYRVLEFHVGDKGFGEAYSTNHEESQQQENSSWLILKYD